MTSHRETSRPGRAATAAILAAAAAATCSCDGREPPAPVAVEIIEATTVWCSGYDMGARIRIDVRNKSGRSIRPTYVTVETGPDPDTGEGEASGMVSFTSTGSIAADSTATVRCGSGLGWYMEPSSETDALPLRITAHFERLPDDVELEETATGTLVVEHWYDSCYTWGTNTCYEE